MPPGGDPGQGEPGPEMTCHLSTCFSDTVERPRELAAWGFGTWHVRPYFSERLMKAGNESSRPAPGRIVVFYLSVGCLPLISEGWKQFPCGSSSVGPMEA